MERPARVARVNIISVGGGEEYVDILGVLAHGRDCAGPGVPKGGSAVPLPNPQPPGALLGGYQLQGCQHKVIE